MVNRKNGVPSAPPWQAWPSMLNGVAMQEDEIGCDVRDNYLLSAVNGRSA